MKSNWKSKNEDDKVNAYIKGNEIIDWPNTKMPKRKCYVPIILDNLGKGVHINLSDDFFLKVLSITLLLPLKLLAMREH